MTRAEETKQRIVAATADLLMQQGYHATGLNEIVRRSAAPKGSLYFHFPHGKEQIVAAALHSAGEWTCGHVGELLRETESAADAVAGIALSFATMLEQNNFSKGCALLAVSQEVGEGDERLRKALDEGFAAWRRLFVNKFVESGFPSNAAQVWADMALSAIEGAQALARAQRSTRPLKNTALLLRSLIDDAQREYAAG